MNKAKAKVMVKRVGPVGPLKVFAPLHSVKVTESPRVRAVHDLLIKAACECSSAKNAECYKTTPKFDEWCWPCRTRWSHRIDAAKWVAPVDDVL